MSASGLASAAAGDMAGVVAGCQQMKTMLGQINMVRAQLENENCKHAKGKIAAATQTAAGGTGTGQNLQVRVGQSEVKLQEIAKLLGTLAGMCDGAAQHAKGVENDIRQWAATLRS
jgi:hypothetical protein